MVHRLYTTCPYCTSGEEFRVINNGNTGTEMYSASCPVCKLEFHVEITFSLNMRVQRKHKAYTNK